MNTVAWLSYSLNFHNMEMSCIVYHDLITWIYQMFILSSSYMDRMRPFHHHITLSISAEGKFVIWSWFNERTVQLIVIIVPLASLSTVTKRKSCPIILVASDVECTLWWNWSQPLRGGGSNGGKQIETSIKMDTLQ